MASRPPRTTDIQLAREGHRELSADDCPARSSRMASSNLSGIAVRPLRSRETVKKPRMMRILRRSRDWLTAAFWPRTPCHRLSPGNRSLSSRRLTASGFAEHPVGEPPGQPNVVSRQILTPGWAGSVEDPRSPSTSSGQAPRRGLQRVVRRRRERADSAARRLHC